MFQGTMEPADVDPEKRLGKAVSDVQVITTASVGSGRKGCATKAVCVSMVTDSGTLQVYSRQVAPYRSCSVLYRYKYIKSLDNSIVIHK